MRWPWHRRTVDDEAYRREHVTRPACLMIDGRGIVHYTVGRETGVIGTISADDDDPIATAKHMAARFPRPVGHVHLMARTKAAPPLGY